MSLSTAKESGAHLAGSLVSDAQTRIKDALRITEPWKLVVYTVSPSDIVTPSLSPNRANLAKYLSSRKTFCPRNLQALTTYGIIRLRDFYNASEKSISARLRSWMISYARRLPSVQKEIQAKTAEQRAKLEYELLGKQVAGIPSPHAFLPALGMTHGEVLQMAEKYIRLGTIAGEAG